MIVGPHERQTKDADVNRATINRQGRHISLNYMRRAVQFTCIEAVDFLDFGRDFIFEASFATAEISNDRGGVLLFGQLLNENVQWVLRPLLDLLPIAIVVVDELLGVLSKDLHGLLRVLRVQLLVQVAKLGRGRESRPWPCTSASGP